MYKYTKCQPTGTPNYITQRYITLSLSIYNMYKYAFNIKIPSQETSR